MQSATGQYSTHAGEPAHPVQHSVMTASSLGFFLRGVVSPVDLGSNFISSGTIPAVLFPVVSAGISCADYTEKKAILLSPAVPPQGPHNQSPQAAPDIRPARKSWESPPNWQVPEGWHKPRTVTLLMSTHHNFHPPVSAIVTLLKE